MIQAIDNIKLDKIDFLIIFLYLFIFFHCYNNKNITIKSKEINKIITIQPTTHLGKNHLQKEPQFLL